MSLDKLAEFDLKIELADATLQKLLWEAHILLNGFFNSGSFVKLYENAHGVSWGKQYQQVLVGPQPQQKIKPQ